MKLKFVNIIGDNAVIKLYKHIGYDDQLGQGVDGLAVANEIDYINLACPNIKNIDVKINSTGGSVHEGLSICNAILDSKTQVTTNIVGMAYSMAGVIAVCGHKKKIAKHGTFMMHDASGGSDDKVLDLITNSLARIFENNTALTLEKCRAMMKKETWMGPEDCKSLGFEVTASNIPMPNTTNALERHAFYNKYLNKQPAMIKLTNLLKLSNEASEDAITEKVEAIVTENTSVKVENQTLKTERDSFKSKLDAIELQEAEKEKLEKETVLNEAVTAEKITAADKAKWVDSPIKARDLKNLFDSIKTKPAFVPAFDPKKVDNKLAAERGSWTYSDWEKKDPEGLQEIQNSNPTEFERLVKTINTTLKSKY